MTGSPVHDVLYGAVAALGGQERPGQVAMADAVEAALSNGEHLLVQAGTGTGKSLAYLVPALLHPRPVVVATATLALQHQLVERDLPALVTGAAEQLGAAASATGGDGAGADPAGAAGAARRGVPAVPYAVLKGRSNYACLHRVREGTPDDTGVLVDVPEGSLGGEVVRLRSWAEEEAERGGRGDRDAAPTHTDRGWAQVAVSARECLGAQRCPYAGECFAERARDTAMDAQVVVTNHALLAIDAIDGVPMLPEHSAVVVDEGHELVARVTQASTDELSPAAVERASRRVRAAAGPDGADRASDLTDASEALRDALDGLPGGRLDSLPTAVADALALVRDAARACYSALGGRADATVDGDSDAVRQQAKAAADDIRKVAERLAADSEHDVRWITARERPGGGGAGNELRVAPLDVSLSLRERLFGRAPVVLTSATLKLGGGFEPVAASLGLRPEERVGSELPTGTVEAPAETIEPEPERPEQEQSEQPEQQEPADEPVRWRGLDVGSPFDYQRQAILYVARRLPAPGRDGLAERTLDEIVSLVEAVDGRTLGLFSSRRAAETAAEHVRGALPGLDLWCQGDAQLPELQRRFVEDPRTCLFGTLSLWQGVDLPGETCQLVIIDRIPFPRPDDPLMSARQRAVERRGGNGFMSVAATSAALLLAQGSGRLIRRADDRGVVAVLDPRLVTARYGPFLAASLPPMWRTIDGEVARAALRRLRVTGHEPQHAPA
jgi:ATP-dependent DNA helicase DinG